MKLMPGLVLLVAAARCMPALAVSSFSTKAIDYAVAAKGSATLQTYSVVSGDVYAGSDITLEFGYGIQRPAQNAGKIIAGDDVTVESLSDVNGDVYAGGMISLLGSADVTGNQFPGSSLIPAVTLPGAKVFTPGTTNIATNNAFALPPGSYGTVSHSGLFDAFTLSAGNYYIKTLEFLTSCDLYLDLTGGPINVFIEEDLRVTNSFDVFVNGVEVSSSMPASLTNLASQVLFEVHDDVDIDASITSEFFGTIFAPNSDVDIQVSDFYGAILSGGSVRAEAYLVRVPSQFLSVPEPASWAAALPACAAAFGCASIRRRKPRGIVRHSSSRR